MGRKGREGVHGSGWVRLGRMRCWMTGEKAVRPLFPPPRGAGTGGKSRGGRARGPLTDRIGPSLQHANAAEGPPERPPRSWAWAGSRPLPPAAGAGGAATRSPRFSSLTSSSTAGRLALPEGVEDALPVEARGEVGAAAFLAEARAGLAGTGPMAERAGAKNRRDKVGQKRKNGLTPKKIRVESRGDVATFSARGGSAPNSTCNGAAARARRRRSCSD